MEDNSLMERYTSLAQVKKTLSNYVQPVCPLVHQFSEGVYIREITMPTGSFILGYEHTTTHMNMISKGELYQTCHVMICHFAAS